MRHSAGARPRSSSTLSRCSHLRHWWRSRWGRYGSGRHPGTHLKIVLAFGPGANWYSIAVVATYFTLSVFATNGLTLGKRLCGIRVVSTVHERISLWHALERALGYVVSAGELGLGFAQYFTTSNCRTTHDRIAQTIVVRTSGGVVGTPGQGAGGSTRGAPDRGQSRPDSPDATATLALPTGTQVPQRESEAKDTTNAKP